MTCDDYYYYIMMFVSKNVVDAVFGGFGRDVSKCS